MAWWKKYRWLFAVSVGLVGGVALCQFWPRNSFEIPIRAMATDRIDTYGMATGALDSELEAVYFLDFLTGQLTAVVVGKQGGIFGVLQADVAGDLRVDPQKNPKFMMVTGFANLRRAGSRLQFSSALCYVAEVTTGQVAAYAVQWSPTMYQSGQPAMASLLCVGKGSFRGAISGPIMPGPGPRMR
jgi:hypothetical protein